MDRLRILPPSMLALAIALGGGGDDDVDPQPRVPVRTPDDVDDAPPPSPPSDLPVSRELQGQPVVHVEGAPVELAGGQLFAVLTEDLDGDEDRDALAVGLDANGELALLLARREGATFQSRALGSLAPADVVGAPARCERDEVVIRFLSPTWAHAQATLRCDTAVDGKGDPRESLGEEAFPITGHFFIEVGQGTPRLKERVMVARSLVLEPFLEDLDGDGHLDFRLHLTGPGALALDLPLQDRAAGLILDPEPAFQMLAGELDETERALADDPTAAAERTERVVSWSRLLCRDFEPATPVSFHVGDAAGLRCPATQRAEQLDLVARIRSGDLVGAIAALDPLAPEVRRRALAGDAMAAALAPLRARVTTTDLGAGFEGDLVFRDDATLALLGEPPVRLTLADGSRAPDPGVPAIIDPQGHHSARLAFHCDGVRLKVVDAFRPGAVLAETQVTAEAAPEPCTGQPTGPQRWRILGWAPQGILVGAPGARRLATTVVGPSFEGTEDLGLTTPAPAPLRGPRVTPTGDVWIIETPLGVLRYEGARAKLWWPEGWPTGERPEAVALSPDGSRIAVRTSDGRVAVMDASE